MQTNNRTDRTKFIYFWKRHLLLSFLSLHFLTLDSFLFLTLVQFNIFSLFFSISFFISSRSPQTPIPHKQYKCSCKYDRHLPLVFDSPCSNIICMCVYEYGIWLSMCWHLFMCLQFICTNQEKQMRTDEFEQIKMRSLHRLMLCVLNFKLIYFAITVSSLPRVYLFIFHFFSIFSHAR